MSSIRAYNRWCWRALIGEKHADRLCSVSACVRVCIGCVSGCTVVVVGVVNVEGFVFVAGVCWRLCVVEFHGVVLWLTMCSHAASVDRDAMCTLCCTSTLWTVIYHTHNTSPLCSHPHVSPLQPRVAHIFHLLPHTVHLTNTVIGSSALRVCI